MKNIFSQEVQHGCYRVAIRTGIKIKSSPKEMTGAIGGIELKIGCNIAFEVKHNSMNPVIVKRNPFPSDAICLHFMTVSHLVGIVEVAGNVIFHIQVSEIYFGFQAGKAEVKSAAIRAIASQFNSAVAWNVELEWARAFKRPVFFVGKIYSEVTSGLGIRSFRAGKEQGGCHEDFHDSEKKRKNPRFSHDFLRS